VTRRVRHPYYMLDGQRVVPCTSFLSWAHWFEDANRCVGYTQITSQCNVSTTFLGLDHRHFGDGPPLVFETMIFGGPDEIAGSQWRYSSWDDAEIGHKAAVRKAREALGQKVKP
jgi:hypothetical protein